MKRGGLLLAALLLVGGVLRIGVPSPVFRSGRPEGAVSAPAKRTHAAAKAALPVVIARTGYEAELENTIRESFGTFNEERKSSEEDSSKFWGVPSQVRARSTHVIAILPDPVHTQLALFFDRSIESLQIAAQKQGYEFDRAILPWEREAHPESPDADIRAKTEAVRKNREANPGLLIFREGSARRRAREHGTAGPQESTAAQQVKDQEAPLFVWVVGEAPTSGIRKGQFEKARRIISEIRAPGANHSPQAPLPLLILGPTFSGSLASLRFELKQNRPEFAFVYSGTVTGSSAREFADNLSGYGQFASFFENDDYLLAQFLEFAYSRGYDPKEIAILSEDETVYGEMRKDPKSPDESCPPQSCIDLMDPPGGKSPSLSVLARETKLTCADYKQAFHLHFPREISQFRAAYQRRAAEVSQSGAPLPYSPGNSTLPLDLAETGSNDDTVAPYAASQSTLSQEAIMLGIVTALRKHEIRYIVLLATDPLDELFLARYLRQSYPQGRVVVATPDLLSAREEDSLLNGLIGINSYPLFPGLNDRLAKPVSESVAPHEDRIFDSSLSEGTFNAMVGLLAAAELAPGEWRGFAKANPLVPKAPYIDYGSPALADVHGQPLAASSKPLLWLSMLGRDGFWPVAGIAEDPVVGADVRLPVINFCPKDGSQSTLKQIHSPVSNVELDEKDKMPVPGAWRIAYFLCVLMMFVHAYFSWFGTVLSDSEAMAQFARATPINGKEEEGIFKGSVILTSGAFCLASAFGLIMTTRHPLGSWKGDLFWTLVLWFPLVVFVFVVAWDLSGWRRSPVAAALFVGLVILAVTSELLLVLKPWPFLRYHGVFWSTRVLHLGSGVSPVLPVLLLAAAAYWWFWMSLRGVSLVDLRRPRLPEKKDLPDDYFRMDDAEAEKLRRTAYPLNTSKWQAAPLIALACLVLAILDYGHPVQTIEGRAYDWGFSFSLAILTALFLGTLLKLVRTWMETQQILSALDRRAIREAFSRLKGFSWKPIWNPGGSTLRESYRVLSRAMENLDRFHEVIHPGSNADCKEKEEEGDKLHDAVRGVLARRKELIEKYRGVTTAQPAGANQNSAETSSQKNESRFSIGNLKNSLTELLSLKKHSAKQTLVNSLLTEIEQLQRKIAEAAGIFMKEFLADLWSRASSPVASADPRKDKMKPPLRQILAEEYVALVYVNFLVSALLRMRTLVICGVGMYVLLLCSVSVYPFEPRPALQTLSVIMIVALGLAIGYVYAQMHRDPILSRLTETSAGELGWDFYVKFIAAGAVPVLSLLASQFPAINNALFSWLEPALQALK